MPSDGLLVPKEIHFMVKQVGVLAVPFEDLSAEGWIFFCNRLKIILSKQIPG
jgi:hypothetical protein